MKIKKKKVPTKSRLARLAERAMREAVAGAIKECRSKGLSIAIWKDNKTVLLPPQKIK